MLKVRKVVIALILLILILGMYINVQAIDIEDGTINPIYRPTWEKVSITTNTENQTISVTFKGYAEADFSIGNTVTDPQKYLSKVTSSITAGNDPSNLLLVKIDGELDGDTDGDGILEDGESPSITKTIVEDSKTDYEVQYTVTLSGFKELVRQSRKKLLRMEWKYSNTAGKRDIG